VEGKDDAQSVMTDLEAEIRSLTAELQDSGASGDEQESQDGGSQASLSDSNARHGQQVDEPNTEVVDRRSMQAMINKKVAGSTQSGRNTDNSAFGIPSTVIIDGKAVDISEMDILEQVEMLRQAAAQKQAAKLQARHQAGPTSPLLEELDQVKYTELSDIA
jgi:hypothetical protein